MRLRVGILIGSIAISGDAAFAQNQGTTICGRVAAVSCTNNRSEVRIRVSEPMRGVMWAVQIPSGVRNLFEARLLNGLDDANVCIRTAVRPLGRDVMLLRPENLIVSEDSTRTRYQDEVVHSCDADVEMPTIMREVKASMTADAMRAKINGAVLLRAVVDISGSVRDVRVVQGLEPSQDTASREALEQWIFKPARRHGEPVPMRISVEMHFTVR